MQSLKLDNGDLPCNVSTIDSEHNKRVDQTRRREELEEGMAGGWRGLEGWATWAKRYHLWDNVEMGRGWRGGRGAGYGDSTKLGITWVSYDLRECVWGNMIGWNEITMICLLLFHALRQQHLYLPMDHMTTSMWKRSLVLMNPLTIIQLRSLQLYGFYAIFNSQLRFFFVPLIWFILTTYLHRFHPQ